MQGQVGQIPTSKNRCYRRRLRPTGGVSGSRFKGLTTGSYILAGWQDYLEW